MVGELMPMLPKLRDQLGSAKAERANLIYALGICVCGFPIIKSDTATQHTEGCPAHIHLMKRREMEDVLAQMTRPKRRGRRQQRPMTLKEVKAALVEGCKEGDAARQTQKRSPRR